MVFSVLVLRAQAEDFTSASFKIRAPILDDFGGRSTSGSFESFNAGSQISTGESTSANFIVRAGFLYFDEFTPKSQNWRWYDDEASVTPVTPLAAENVAPANVAQSNIIKLRLTVKETASIGGKDVKLRLQFSEYSDFSQGVSNVAETGPCVSLSLWCYADGGGADGGIITTKVLTDADACSGGSGNGCGTHNESGTSSSTFNHKKDAATEYEFTIKHAGARANATYFFRAFDVAGDRAVPLNVGETSPSVSVEGGTLTFTVSGLAGGTASEGITTDVATTPTSVAFGNLSFDAETEAAQRLSVTTNATEGYQVFLFQTQGLLRNGPSEILPVTATNASPAVWAIPGGAGGAYGYHAGDDTLAAGSVRFAPNNTYAKFETAPKEIAYSSGPVSAEATDVVFKTQVTNQQESGAYESNVIYIAVPTF